MLIYSNLEIIICELIKTQFIFGYGTCKEVFMDKYSTQASVIDLKERGRLEIRLRILWYLWSKKSIDSYAFNNTEDILFGLKIMLKNKIYSKNIIEQLEDKTLHYLFPKENGIKYDKPHQKRYLLLQRLFSFIGGYAGLSFAARYGYIAESKGINFSDRRELSTLEDSALSLCDFLTSISIKDIKTVNFYALTK